MLSPHVPELSALELLLAIDRTGSLGSASRHLGVSQPAVTFRLQGMERLVGLPLVQRSHGGSALTPAGALLADWARSVISSAEVLDAGIAALRQQRDARLRLAASLTVAEHLLPGWLVRFSRRWPRSTVALTAVNSGEVAELVANGSVDLGFVEGPRTPAGLSSRTVGRDRLVVVVSPDHPWARRRSPLPAAELAGTRLVQREVRSGTRAALDAALAAVGPTAPPLLELSTATGVRAAAAGGAAPAVLSSLAVAEDLAQGRLVEVEVADVVLDRLLRAVWIRGQRPSGPAADLLTLVGRRREPAQRPSTGT